MERGEKAPEKASGIPRLAARSNVSDVSQPNNLPQSPTTNHRFLSPAEWARVAHGLGAVHDGSETHAVVHPTAWYWPPKGLPDGLYRDVIAVEARYEYKYQIISNLRWVLMILQIMVGAALTALGSFGVKQGAVVTILAAVNTLDAGLLALLHNSGLPDRYRLDKAEFSQVTDFIKELLDTGVVDNNLTVDEILSDCFERFRQAKATVRANMPAQYTPSLAFRATTPPKPSPRQGEATSH